MGARKPPRFSLERAPVTTRIDNEPLDRIAKLAKVPEAHREYFFSLVSDAMREAQYAPTAKAERLPTEKVIEQLNGLVNNARVLRNKLTAMNPRARTLTPPVLAGKFFLGALNDKGMKFEDYLDHLNMLEEAAKTAIQGARPKKGRPGGIRTAFDAFIYELLDAAHIAGGNLTIYKSAHAATGWNGTLLEAVSLLKPLLPEKFVPRTAIDSLLDRVRAIHARDREKTRARP